MRLAPKHDVVCGDVDLARSRRGKQLALYLGGHKAAFAPARHGSRIAPDALGQLAYAAEHIDGQIDRCDVFVFHDVAMLPQPQHPVNTGFQRINVLPQKIFSQSPCVVDLCWCMITHRFKKSMTLNVNHLERIMTTAITTTPSSADELGTLLAQIATLTKQADAIKDAMKDIASKSDVKVFEGALFKASYVEANRSVTDWKKLAEAISIPSDVIASFTTTTAVFSIKTTSR